MRPRILKFVGIGPYPNEVNIDFDKLSTLGLYLIVGPTGAGKSTIFDALTYALYGKVAGDRPEKGLVSDFSNRGKPIIELSFSHQGRNFEIHRELKIDDRQIPPGRQWLREASDAGVEIRTVTGIQNIATEIEELIGLDASQFMKVVLLPQSKFQEFLMANTTDKIPLLRSVFGTDLYTKIVMRMKYDAQELEAAATKAGIILNNEIYTTTAVVRDLASTGFADSLPDPSIDLEKTITSLSILGGAASIEAVISQTLLSNATKDMANARTDATRFEASTELTEIASLHTKLSDAVTDARQKIDANTRATRVITQLSLTEAAVKASDEAGSITVDSRQNITRTISALKAGNVASKFIAAVPTGSANGLNTELEHAINAYRDALSKFNEIDAQNNDLRNEVERKRTAAKIKTTKSKALSSDRILKLRLSTQLTAARKADRDLPRFEAEEDKLDDLIASADVSTTQAANTRAITALRNANAKSKTAQASFENALETHNQHLAGTLATKLVRGQLCPVCGSIEHPKKAKRIAKVDLDEVNRRRDDAHRVMTKAEALLLETQTHLSLAQKARKSLPTIAAQNQIRKKKISAEKLAGSVESLETDLEECEENIESATVAITEATTIIKSATAAEKKLTERIVALTNEATKLGTKSSVQKMIRDFGMVSRLVEDLENKISHSAKAHATAQTQQASLVLVLNTEDFASVAVAMKQSIQKEIASKLNELITTSEIREKRITQLDAIIGSDPLPKILPDLDGLEAILDAATLESESKSTCNNVIEHALKQLNTSNEKIKKIGPDAKEKSDQAKTISFYARIFDRGGTGAQHEALGLETWVLRTLFEEVCEFATQQMFTLSRGRYQLTLDPDGAKRRRGGGLDLYVVDGHNGKTRPVQSLSGGEQFLTSLALALALAEVVQRHSGGLELSSLFIDEGFGSLDGETLDAAIDALRSLYDSGRTVGVITHVDAMQQELQVGLQVYSSQSGSTLKMFDSD